MIPLPRLTEKQILRFWAGVDIQGFDECWIWKGYLRQGYGRFKVQGIRYEAHRIAYFLHNKKDPKELLVCHSCDNPACCNPKHLWLGTSKDNIQDSVKRVGGQIYKESSIRELN